MRWNWIAGKQGLGSQLEGRRWWCGAGVNNKDLVGRRVDRGGGDRGGATGGMGEVNITLESNFNETSFSETPPRPSIEDLISRVIPLHGYLFFYLYLNLTFKSTCIHIRELVQGKTKVNEWFMMEPRPWTTKHVRVLEQMLTVFSSEQWYAFVWIRNWINKRTLFGKMLWNWYTQSWIGYCSIVSTGEILIFSVKMIERITV